jgi:tetratricopeptide (TPR) repeat protein
MLRRRFWLLCMALALAAPAAAQSSPPIATLIDSYADWVYGRRSGVDLIAIDLDAARQELGRINPSKLPVPADLSPAAAKDHQRRLIAAFALELAAVGSKKHSSAAARLVEFACPLVRSHTPHDEYDRAWQLAALSVLEGGIDSATLRAHLAHLPPELSDDPRVTLAHGIAEEQFSAPNEVLTRSITAAGLARAREELSRQEGERYRASERAVARFRDAAADDAIGAEATLRMGHVQLRMGHPGTALATWGGLDARVTDPALMYLLNLFRGLAYEQYNRIEPARASYLAALKLSPGAHSATMRLAALMFLHGHAGDPYPLVDALLKDDDARRDPWWSYYAGDWRFWYPRIERVRTLLVQP